MLLDKKHKNEDLSKLKANSFCLGCKNNSISSVSRGGNKGVMASNKSRVEVAVVFTRKIAILLGEEKILGVR